VPFNRLLQNDYIINKSIKCLSTNFESILSKIDELRINVNNVHPDVIFGCETWLKEDTPDVLIDIPGFNVF
jgi:hypothetical protein